MEDGTSPLQKPTSTPEKEENLSQHQTRNWLAAAIKVARGKAGLSAAEVSRQAGYSASYVTKIESGKLDPSVIAFARIARVLKLSADEIAWIIMLVGVERKE